jgi:hypothetical protein
LQIAYNHQIGNEFSAVEALWSQFETVMSTTSENGGDNGAREPESASGEKQGEQDVDDARNRDETETETETVQRRNERGG